MINNVIEKFLMTWMIFVFPRQTSTIYHIESMEKELEREHNLSWFWVNQLIRSRREPSADGMRVNPTPTIIYQSKFHENCDWMRNNNSEMHIDWNKLIQIVKLHIIQHFMNIQFFSFFLSPSFLFLFFFLISYH